MCYLYSFCIDFTFGDNFMFIKFMIFNRFESNNPSYSNENWSLGPEIIQLDVRRCEINSCIIKEIVEATLRSAKSSTKE